MENHHFNGKIHYKWPFSIAMLVYHRVSIWCCHWTTGSTNLPGNIFFWDVNERVLPFEPFTHVIDVYWCICMLMSLYFSSYIYSISYLDQLFEWWWTNDAKKYGMCSEESRIRCCVHDSSRVPFHWASTLWHPISGSLPNLEPQITNQSLLVGW